MLKRLAGSLPLILALLASSTAYGQQMMLSPDNAVDSRNEPVYTKWDKTKNTPPVPHFRITAPFPIKVVDGKLTTNMKAQGSSPNVVVSGIVSESGDFIDLKIAKTSDPEASQSALVAAAGWKFVPAKLHGRPVAVRMNAALNWVP